MTAVTNPPVLDMSGAGTNTLVKVSSRNPGRVVMYGAGIVCLVGCVVATRLLLRGRTEIALIFSRPAAIAASCNARE